MLTRRFRPYVIVTLALFTTVATMTSTAWAKTNRNRIRSRIEKKYHTVVYLKHINHAEYVKFSAALAGAGITSGLSLELWWIDFKTEMVAKFGDEVGKKITLPIFLNLLRGIDQVVAGKKLQGGVLTYKHWTEEKIPDGFRLDGSIIWKTIKKPEPNTFQPYIGVVGPSDIANLPFNPGSISLPTISSQARTMPDLSDNPQAARTHETIPDDLQPLQRNWSSLSPNQRAIVIQLVAEFADTPRPEEAAPTPPK